MVQDDFELLCWDFVSTPSNPGSYMTYDVNKFFRHKLPNYKSQAALYTLIEIKANPNLNNIKHEISNKLTILEHLSSTKLTPENPPTLIKER